MTITKRRAGFTLIELLVSIGIIGILIGLLMPAVMYSQATMRQSHCKANLHQIGLALQSYVDRQGAFGIFPDAAILPTLTPERPTIAQVLGPFIEENKPVFICPSDTVYAEEQGLSYEYPAGRLANKRREQLTMNRRGEEAYSSSEVLIMYDFENFHGVWQRGSRVEDENENTYFRGSRNFLYLDGHVDNF
jgi:prepilin-type N-terminal cleavage/methylation domain-containing protein/prepilin-type processing-associated H-X9-DG protein